MEYFKPQQRFIPKPGATVRGKVRYLVDNEAPKLDTHKVAADNHIPGKYAKATDTSTDESIKAAQTTSRKSTPFRLPMERRPATVSITGSSLSIVNGLYHPSGGNVNGAVALQQDSKNFWLRRSKDGFWVVTRSFSEEDGHNNYLLSGECQLSHPCDAKSWASWNGQAWVPLPSLSVEYLWDPTLREPAEEGTEKKQVKGTAKPKPDAPTGGGCSSLNTGFGPSAGKAGIPYNCRVNTVGGKLAFKN